MIDETVDRCPLPLNDKLKRRGVWFSCVTYLEPCDFSYALSKASHWAYIYHDKDLKEDESGELKEPHYHILLHYDNARSGYAVLRDFAGKQNTMCEVVTKGNEVASYEYLYHFNDPDKYQYDKADLVVHNPIYWEHFLPSVRDRTQADFIEDLLQDDELDIVYMARKYGRDFIKNYKSYMDFRHEVRIRERFN